jgi:GNAT superfamily N-acetyltransferase
MKVRQIHESDLPALGRAYVNSFKEVDPSEEWTEERAVALLKFIYSKQPDLSFLVEDNGEIGGGALGMIKPWWDGNHLVETELFLVPAFQNKGIGTALFLHFLQFAVEKYQVNIMESLTFKNLDFPLSWYVRLGFEPKSEWQVMFGDVKTVINGLKKSV